MSARDDEGRGGPPRRRLLVDGMNVIGSRPDGWWHDRAGAMRDLVARLGELSRRDDVDVTVALEGRELSGLEEGRHHGVSVRWAQRRGPDAADDRIAQLVEDDDDPSSLEVATADQELAERVEARGASTTSPKSLRKRLDDLGDGSLGRPDR